MVTERLVTLTGKSGTGNFRACSCSFPHSDWSSSSCQLILCASGKGRWGLFPKLNPFSLPRASGTWSPFLHAGTLGECQQQGWRDMVLLQLFSQVLPFSNTATAPGGTLCQSIPATPGSVPRWDRAWLEGPLLSTPVCRCGTGTEGCCGSAAAPHHRFPLGVSASPEVLGTLQWKELRESFSVQVCTGLGKEVPNSSQCAVRALLQGGNGAWAWFWFRFGLTDYIQEILLLRSPVSDPAVLNSNLAKLHYLNPVGCI